MSVQKILKLLFIFVKEKIETKDIKVKYVHRDEPLANFLTK